MVLFIIAQSLCHYKKIKIPVLRAHLQIPKSLQTNTVLCLNKKFPQTSEIIISDIDFYLFFC